MSEGLARDHAHLVGQLRLFGSIISAEDIARSFLASLSSRRLEARSALGSYAFARALPDHALEPLPDTFATICGVCGWSRMPSGYEELEAENTHHFARERMKWGGVRHLDPQYALYDLTEWQSLEIGNPSVADRRCLDLLLRTPALLAPDAKVSHLERALQTVLPSNKSERQTLLQILGYAGVFEAPGYPSFFDDYVMPAARELPRQRFAEWGYPIIWWRARHGVRQDAVMYWFPQASAWSAS